MSQRALEEGDEDKSISSILGKIDSMLLKSKEDVKEYEKRKTEFSSPNEEEEFSYQCEPEGYSILNTKRKLNEYERPSYKACMRLYLPQKLYKCALLYRALCRSFGWLVRHSVGSSRC